MYNILPYIVLSYMVEHVMNLKNFLDSNRILTPFGQELCSIRIEFSLMRSHEEFFNSKESCKF